MVHADLHTPMEPPELEVPIESQIPDGALDQVGHHPTSKVPIQEETGIPELQQLPIVPLQPKPMVLKQPLPQALPMPRSMLLPDTMPKVPDQPVPFHGLINQKPLDMRPLGTLPGYNNDIDDENQSEISIRQPDKKMFRKSKKLFDKILDEMIFRKHLPRQL